MTQRIGDSFYTVKNNGSDQDQNTSPMSSSDNASKEQRHLRAVSDASSRLNDALCILLADWEVPNEHHAILNALDGLSGGRLETFPSYHHIIGRRLQYTQPYNPSLPEKNTGPKKAAQRAIKGLLDAQRKAGLQTFYKKHPCGRIEVQGHILSYWSAKAKGKPGKFRMNIKEYELQIYTQAKSNPNYRKHKSKAVEEVAHRVAAHVKRQSIHESPEPEIKNHRSSSEIAARSRAAIRQIKRVIEDWFEQGKTLEDIQSYIFDDITQPILSYTASLAAMRQRQKDAQLVHHVYDKTQPPILVDRSVHQNHSEESYSGKASATAKDNRTYQERGIQNYSIEVSDQLLSDARLASVSPEIRSTVEVQVEGFISVGVWAFSLKIIEILGRNKHENKCLRHWKKLSRDEALEHIPLVVQLCRNAVEKRNEMWNAIITPYPREGIQLLQADDLDEEIAERLEEFAFQKYRSSDGNGNGNFQVWIAVESCDPTLFYRFKKATGSDMGASRSIRVAGSYNASHWRQRPNGSFPIFTIDDDEPGLLADVTELERAGFVLHKLKASDEPSNPSHPKKPLPDYNYFLNRAHLRKNGTSDDISRVDYTYVKTMADRGYSFDMAIEQLTANSIINRGKHRAEYIKRTVKAAFRDAGRTVVQGEILKEKELSASYKNR